jgi:hypothetical protein
VRQEHIVDTGLEYTPGDRVLVRVVKRDRRERVSDEGRAAAKAGRTSVPEEVARRVEEEFVVNVSRSGEIFLPGERFARRIGEASLALFQDLLELG